MEASSTLPRLRAKFIFRQVIWEKLVSDLSRQIDVKWGCS